MAEAGPRWFPAPSAGDIAWCRFPQDKLPAPGPKARPALVLRVGDDQGHPVVEVAYGSSRKVDALYAGEFAITPSDQAAYVAAGLSYPTKFKAMTHLKGINNTGLNSKCGISRMKSVLGVRPDVSLVASR